MLPFITEKDDKYISGFKPEKYQGITEMQDLILDLGESSQTGELYLFLNGWIFPTDASINVAISQSTDLKVILPYIQVINKKGEWETVIDNLGFPMGKDKTVIADLSGKMPYFGSPDQDQDQYGNILGSDLLFRLPVNGPCSDQGP